MNHTSIWVNKVTISLIIFLLCSSYTFLENIGKPIRWPKGAKAAICLTYDDGMDTHLKNAIPQLNKYQLKGTFYLNSIQGTSTVVGWKKAARDGHELGNHSLFHPCPRSMGWADDIATDFYSVDRILEEIRTQDEILQQLDPGRKKRSYGYPCNYTTVGDGVSYVKALQKSKLVAYARGGGAEQTVITDFGKLNVLHTPSWAAPDSCSLQPLLDYAEKARQAGGLAIFQFHGVGGQWLMVSNETHEGLLKFLKENASDFWVAPFSEVMEYVEKQR